MIKAFFAIYDKLWALIATITKACFGAYREADSAFWKVIVG